jgi:hypothetical protein
MNKKGFYFFIGIMLFVLIGNVYAVSTRDGKRKFKKYCYKKCHKYEENILITPTYFTKEQWNDLFKNNHKKLKDVHINGEFNKLKKLKNKHYENMRMYLIKHSLDSEQPEVCG